MDRTSMNAAWLSRPMGGTTFLAVVLVMSLGLAHADVQGAAEALKHMDASVSAVEDAAKHASQGHGDQISLHSRQAIQHAELAIEAMPMGNAHGREAASLLKEAITNLNRAIQFANGGNTDKAAEHVNSALDLADAAISHVRHSH